MLSEKFEFFGARKYPGREALFDGERTASILCFVHLRAAFPFLFRQ